jgi:hypothetical protein
VAQLRRRNANKTYENRSVRTGQGELANRRLDVSPARIAIIRPTETKGVAMGALKFLSSSNLFLGQSKAFFAYLTDLAEDADEARRL